MTIEDIKQELISHGKDPDNYSIFIHAENGYTIWEKEFAPIYMKAAEQQAEYIHRQMLAELSHEQAQIVTLQEEVLRLRRETDNVADVLVAKEVITEEEKQALSKEEEAEEEEEEVKDPDDPIGKG